MKDKLTILTTTHFKASAHRLDKNYKFDHSRSTTSTLLIESTIEKLYDYLGHRDIQHYISLDHDPSDEGSCLYLDNLRKLLVDYPNISLIVTTTGIRQSIINLINSVSTDYLLWFEHDWHFERIVPIPKLIELMDINSDINYIRFNKRDNIILNCDSNLIEKTFNVDNLNISLCGTNGWSNNPYLGRTDNWKNVWMEYLNDPSVKDHITIERELQDEYQRQIKETSFEDALKKWGVYIYDKLGAPRSVYHVNGKVL
jgi:hypothetical protein